MTNILTVWRRKRFLINPRFQLSFMLYMYAVSAIMIMVLFSTNISFLISCIDAGAKLNLPKEHAYFQLIESQRGTMKLIFLVGSSVVFICMTVLGLLLSHRVAGPLYRLRKFVEAMKAGKNDAQLEFRKNDYFPELAEAITDYIQPSGKGSKKSK